MGRRGEVSDDGPAVVGTLGVGGVTLHLQTTVILQMGLIPVRWITG